MATLNTSTSGAISAEEVSALKSKYGEPLNRDDYIKYVVSVGVLCMAYGVVTTYYWFVAVILFVLGCLYGYRKVLPSVIEQDYFMNSMNERDVFIVNMTQILSDKSKTINSALQRASDRAKGELYNDLRVLLAKTASGTREEVHNAYKDIRDKYAQDMSFGQFMEQLETISLEGKSNLETLKELKSQHNSMVKKQNEFTLKKDESWKGVKRMVGIGLVAIVVMESAFGFKTSFEAYCRAPSGWITSLLFVGMTFYFLNAFRKIYFDDDIMSLKSKFTAK